MGMTVSEKNFLEKIASHVPGVSGYREREARRETDRRLREFLAGRLDEARRSLDAVRNAATRAGELGILNEAGRLDRALQKGAAGLRFADYGYSGLFDQVKIREVELDRIYAYDEALLADVVAIAELLATLAGAAPDGEALSDLARRAEELDRRIGRRKELFDTPAV
jgi:hypothetical protein